MNNILLNSLKNYSLFENEELLSLELLKVQGFCNINYLLKTSKQKYLIRVFKSDATVNISRNFEFEIQNKAYKKNIAAKPLLLDKNNALMICDFLEGYHKEKLTNSDIKHLIKNIKILHSIKSKKKIVNYNLKNDFINYSKNLKDDKSYKLITKSLKIIKVLKKLKKQYVITHHDLNPKNIIFNHGIKFIDWEYSGKNDIFFDLATICYEFKLNKKEEKLLLTCYFKYLKKEYFLKLESYKIIYGNLCKLWFMNLKIHK